MPTKEVIIIGIKTGVSQVENSYQVIIIGAGPAGMTAALYAARKGLKTLIVSKNIGGQVNWTSLVENYMGFAKIQGPELIKRFEEHMREGNLTYLEEEVLSLQQDNDSFTVESKVTGIHKGHAVIVATGKIPRRLGVPGEKKFGGTGVAYCSTCDAPLYREAKVAVVGGGNSAVEAVLDLLGVNAQEVHLLVRRNLSADRLLTEQIKKDPRVQIHLNKEVSEIIGEQMVNSIKIIDRESKEETNIAVEGIFVEIGLNPNSDFLTNLAKNEQQEIIIDCQCRTNIEGIFAAGDVTHIPAKQIIVAAGEGAKAAIQATEYLRKKGIFS